MVSDSFRRASRSARASARVKGFEYDSFIGVCDLVVEPSGVIAGSEPVLLGRALIVSVASNLSLLDGFAVSLGVLFFGG